MVMQDFYKVCLHHNGKIPTLDLGVSSIYNTGGTVGIATTNPQFTLQVGNNQIDGVREV